VAQESGIAANMLPANFFQKNRAGPIKKIKIKIKISSGP
jgi:hypothetical protein